MQRSPMPSIESKILQQHMDTYLQNIQVGRDLRAISLVANRVLRRMPNTVLREHQFCKFLIVHASMNAKELDNVTLTDFCDMSDRFETNS